MERKKFVKYEDFWYNKIDVLFFNLFILTKKAFTLVELIVVITILAILGTIAFVSFLGYTKDANRSKIIYDISNLNSAMQIKLSRWENLDDLVTVSRTNINWVNTWATIGSWAYILKDLKYEVWFFDFKKLWINWSDFKYGSKDGPREYMFAYVKAPNKLSYEFAWETVLQSWKSQVIIKWNYIQYSSTDARWLISESWSDVWLKSYDYLTWSLY